MNKREYGKENIDELKARIAQLEKENSLYQRVFDTIPVGIQIFDKEGFSIKMNNAQKDILGLPNIEEGIGTFNVLTDEYSISQGANLKYEKAYCGEQVQHEFEYDLSHSANNWQTRKQKLYLDETIIPLKDPEGAVDYVLAIINNISKQKSAENKLTNALLKAEESEQCHLFLFENNQQGVVYYDINGKVTKFNTAASNILGVSAEEFKQRLIFDENWKAIYENGKEFRNEDFPVVQSMKTGKPVKNTKMGIYNPQNNDFTWININSFPYLDKHSGELTNILMTFDDITDLHKSIEKAVLAKKIADENIMQFEGLFHNMLQGFALHKMIYDDEGNAVDYRFILINESFEKLTGIKANECIGKTVLEIMPEIEKSWIENYGKIASSGTVMHFENYSQVLEKHYDVVAYSPIKGYFAVIFTDITKSKIHESQLTNARIEAEESNKMKNIFIQNISHEIRTPLNAIVGFSKMLQKKGLSENNKQKFTTYIISSSNQLLSVVTDILTISSIETNQVSLNIEKTDLKDIFDEIQFSYSQQALQKNISLFYKMGLPEQQQIVYADHIKLQHILSNLVSNALKFTLAGIIEYGCRLENENLIFYVKDTGIGIDKNYFNKIYDRFYQVDTPPNHRLGGTGLGLSICAEFVKIHNGKIWLESEIGKGSVFYFSIPFKPVHLQTAIIAESSKLNLLVAEDEELNFFLIEELLKNLHINIIHAHNGEEAVEIVEKSDSIKLILMDIKMPILNGQEAAKRIKSFMPDIPIIAQTAYALPTEMSLYGDIFDDYITKPIDQDLLIMKVKKFMPEIHP